MKPFVLDMDNAFNQMFVYALICMKVNIVNIQYVSISLPMIRDVALVMVDVQHQKDVSAIKDGRDLIVIHQYADVANMVFA